MLAKLLQTQQSGTPINLVQHNRIRVPGEMRLSFSRQCSNTDCQLDCIELWGDGKVTNSGWQFYGTAI